MDKLLNLIRLLLLGTALASASAFSAPPAQALAELAARYYEAQVRMNPVVAGTQAGDNRFDDQLPITIAPAHRARRFAMLRDVQRRLAAIPRSGLNPSDALTYDLLASELQTRLGFEPFPDHLLPLQQMDATPLLLAIFSSGQAEQPLSTPAEIEKYRRRLVQLPAWSTQAIANMREGQRRGIVLPKAVAAATLKQLKALAADCAGGNPYCAPLRQLQGRANADYRRTVEQRVVPAMRTLAAYFDRDYLPTCRDSDGWGALPNGSAWYGQWLRDQTTTDLSAEAIHAIGLKDVARIQHKMAQLAPRLGFEGEPKDLPTWVRTQPRFLPFRSEAQVLEVYRAIDAKVRTQLPRLFGRMPKAALEIKPEPELTKATASDHYALPAPDGSRPGVYWAVINDPMQYDATTMTALFLHEGQPGHHLQMALQQEMPLPLFRKRAWINAFGEGWGLYAETLGHEMGLYDDPAARVGQLRFEIFRAARLVVDTGLHAQGWSRAKAVAYMRDVVGFTEAQAGNQVDRYMAWPAQALGYKLGALKIQALRDRAQQRLGAKFDIAAFHDTVIGEGAMPLSMLDAHIERWIQGRL